MYLFFEKCVRSEFSYASERYSKANNKYLKLYHPKQESKHIIHDLRNYYTLASDQIEIKKEIWSNYQRCLIFVIFLLITLKKLVPNFFDKGKYLLHYEKLQLYLWLRLKIKNFVY